MFAKLKSMKQLLTDPRRQQAPIFCRGMSKKFGKNVVLANVNLEVRPGELLVLTGPSGAGNTTLMSVLAGLEKPTSGQVTAPGRAARGFIFQDFNLLETLTIADNIRVAAGLIGKKVTASHTRELLAGLGLAGLASRIPHELSGGQQQRAAIARVLGADVPYIFADEPTSALDETNARMVMGLLQDSAHRRETRKGT